MADGVWTMVLHHPLRPVSCLELALICLDRATTRKHVVEVIVQGPVRPEAELPEPGFFTRIELHYVHKAENVGSAVAMNESVERFLASGLDWFAKFDDDMAADPGFWDAAIEVLETETRRGSWRVGYAMIAPPEHMLSGKPHAFVITPSGEPGLEILAWNEAYLDRYEAPEAPIQYKICEWTDNGCTMFRREVFEDPTCRVDERLFSGGCNLDLVLSMRKAGWVAALVTKPRCEHHHAWCKPYVYGAVRYDPAHINRGAEVIREKWGYDIPYLSGYRGNGWMKDTIARPSGKNWHRDAVAGKKWKDEGLWTPVGQLQFDFLKARGMKPAHTLLDVGCGALRLGVHAAKYLRPGNYWGIDKEADLIQAGRELEAQRFEVGADLLKNLYVTSTWDVPGDGLFDYMIAHSVFTHIAPELIEDCLVKLVPRLRKPRGRFFATFHESRTGAIDRGVELKGYQAWRKGEVHNTHYPFSLFEELAAKAGAQAVYIGDWGHKFNRLGRQMMMEIKPK